MIPGVIRFHLLSEGGKSGNHVSVSLTSGALHESVARRGAPLGLLCRRPFLLNRRGWRRESGIQGVPLEGACRAGRDGCTRA